MGSDFATKVRALSRHRRISQEELAQMLGVTQSRVSQLLRSKEVKLSQALALAQLFNVSLDYLADSSLPLDTEEEIDLKRRIRDLVARLGPERAYNRLILAERTEMVTPVRPPGLQEDGVYVNEGFDRGSASAAHKARQKPSQ